MNKLEISKRCSFRERYGLVLSCVEIRVPQDPAGLTFCKKCSKKEQCMFNVLLHILKGHGYLQINAVYNEPKNVQGLQQTTHPKKNKRNQRTRLQIT